MPIKCKQETDTCCWSPKGLEKCLTKKTEIMFKNISWSEYLLTVGLVIVLWYLSLGLYHYRKVLMGLLSGKQSNTFFSGDDSVCQNDKPQDLIEEVNSTSLDKDEVPR